MRKRKDISPSMIGWNATKWLLLVLILTTLAVASVFAMEDRAKSRVALPSWNEGAAKQAIVQFVGKVTRVGGPDYVRPEQRIAVFDNDGTLWAEQPMYVQI